MMKKATLTLIALATLAGSTFAGTYRVSYAHHGLGKRITVQAESTAQARRTVQDLFPGAVVTGAHKVGK
jgi:hypothetical protein